MGNEVRWLIATTLGLRDQMMMLKVFLLIAGGTEFKFHHAAPFKRR
jgi:hypothetical protein